MMLSLNDVTSLSTSGLHPKQLTTPSQPDLNCTLTTQSMPEEQIGVGIGGLRARSGIRHHPLIENRVMIFFTRQCVQRLNTT